MFGLMKSICSVESEEQLKKRYLQYCGTCKTIGSMYGNKMRLTLNSDVVFLGELLNSLGDNGKNQEYPSAFRSINCFSLPESNEDLPMVFQYAATVNILLAEVKIDDNINDSLSFLWVWLKKLLSKNFRKATKKLEAWDFPVNEIWNWAYEQKKRERALIESQVSNLSEPAKILEYLSEPTARMTAMTFAHGAKFLHKVNAENQLFDLGYKFGKLIYILDAYEDFTKDFELGEFNALNIAYSIAEEKIPQHFYDEIIQILDMLREEIRTIIYSLPIPSDLSQAFDLRLESNLNMKTHRQFKILPQSCNTNAIKLTIKQKWSLAREKARQIIEQQREQYPVRYLRLREIYLSAYYTLFAIFIPHTLLAQQRSESSNSDSCSSCLALLLCSGCTYFYCKKELNKKSYTIKKNPCGGTDIVEKGPCDC